MDYCVFIHTNHKQILGAKVAEHAMRRNSTHNDRYDIRYLCTEDFDFLKEFDGQDYLRDGVRRPWIYDDLQSFTPLRFMPPEAMGYSGRAVVIDPDIFALTDVWDLLSRDMEGRSIQCRMRSGPKGFVDKCKASSVMLLDCEKLTHWKCEEQFRELFAFERDYQPWVCLKLEDEDSIGFFENEWNDFDRLTADTKMLHNTRRMTQPWKTGLRVDWRPAERFRMFPPIGWIMRARRHLFGEYGLLGKYRRHPDVNQQHLFFGLLRECLDEGKISEQEVREEIGKNHVRHDAFEVLDATPPLAPPGQLPLALPAA